MYFYTHAHVRGNKVNIRGYQDGRRFSHQVDYNPKLYVPSPKPTKWTTLEGDYVDEVELGDIREAGGFVQKYENVSNFKIFGSTKWAYTCINERFGNDYDTDMIRIANIDIEVASEDGFPLPELANQEVTAITVSLTRNGKRQYYVMGVGEYDDSGRDNVNYINCVNEKRLLSAFVALWQRLDPDIVTGWNIEGFDIPYLVNRIGKLFDDKFVKRLSPYGWIKERTIKNFNREDTIYELTGVATLDYLHLYKKFTYSQQESYRLDHIAYVELGERKIDYSEFDNLNQLHKQDYKKFIDYNIKDVEIIDRLEDKMKLIEGALAIAYDAKVNYNDVFTQVTMWDVLIHNYLLSKNIVIPPKEQTFKSEQFAGAYVKDPQVGMHNWVMSFDLNSLYPHLIMQYNISPETFVEDDWLTDVSIEDIIDRKVETHEEYSMAGNGRYFRKDKQGFLPEMMEKMYNERVGYKQKMLAAQTELEEINKRLLEI